MPEGMFREAIRRCGKQKNIQNGLDPRSCWIE